jgi:hypothetical protein
MRSNDVSDTARETTIDAIHWVTDAASDAYFQAIEYTRANPRNAALIALGVGLGVGCLLGRVRSGSRSGLGGLLSSLALAAGGAALDAFRSSDQQGGR